MRATLPPIGTPVSIGLDIAKPHLDVHVLPERQVRQFGNDRDGIAWITPVRPVRIVFEATGACHRPARARAAPSRPAQRPAQPAASPPLCPGCGTRAKTDPVDAALLACLGLGLQPPIAPAPDPGLAALQELHAGRRALVKDGTAALSRAKTLSLALLQQHTQQRLAQIDAQIAAIDHEVLRHQAAHAGLQRRWAILMSIPGLGAITAMALLIDMPELGALEPGQAASFAGLAPIARQSGRWTGRAFIRDGRANVRQALYMPALVAIRFNPDLKAKYEQLIGGGKPAKLAITAIMRKLIVLANALLKARRQWMPKLA